MLSYPFDRVVQLAQSLSTAWRKALSELAKDYAEMLPKRLVQAFTDVLPKATWPVTWIWLFVLMSCHLLVDLAASAFYVLQVGPVAQVRTLVLHIEVGNLLRDLLVTPISLVLLAVLQFAIARAWKGQGTFLEQCYSSLLFLLPLNTISLLLTVLPASMIGIPPALWTFFLLGVLLIMGIANISQLQAAHRLSDGQAVVIVILTALLQTLCSAWLNQVLTRLLVLPT